MTYQIKECNASPRFQLITDDQALFDVCEQARTQSAVALDTEFIRVRTLHPKLGLIQLFAGDEVAFIDPTTILDFSPALATNIPI